MHNIDGRSQALGLCCVEFNMPRKTRCGALLRWTQMGHDAGSP
jgi:hypothetical protein